MQLHTLISSENGPIILWVMYPHRGDELEHTADSIRELVGEEQFTLVAIQIDDWNRDLSPWRSDEVDGSFAGEAGRTLDYIEQQVVPQLDIQSRANRPLYIMGYSLAGLLHFGQCIRLIYLPGVPHVQVQCGIRDLWNM